MVAAELRRAAVRTLGNQEAHALEEAMSGIVRSLGKRPIVIITDRYPPDSHGGAELSLHVLLRGLSIKDQLVVLTFRDQSGVSSYEIEGVSVVVLPQSGTFPYQSVTAQRARGLSVFKPMRLSSEEATDDPHVHAVLRSVKPRGGYSLDYLSGPGSLASRLLSSLARQVEAKLVHADNYRSILILAHADLPPSVRRVGLVRDNRFHCPRHSQAVNVGGKLCGECDFACTDEDALGDPVLLRENLRRVADFRHAALRKLDAVVVTSSYLEDAIRPVVGSANVYRIPNSPDRVEDVRDSLTTEPEMPGLNLLVVGMLNENKGQLPLVKQLPRLLDEVPDAVLHLAGRGDRIGRAIERFVDSKRLWGRVRLHGYLEREPLYRLYRACQVVVLPTVWPEPFGRVPLEAGIARRPCVGFAVGGLKETICPGETGILVEPGDYGGLLAGIRRLARNPALRVKMGQAAFDHVQEQFALEHHASKLPALWRRVMEGIQ